MMARFWMPVLLVVLSGAAIEVAAGLKDTASLTLISNVAEICRSGPTKCSL
jgi:hypothetical protein